MYKPTEEETKAHALKTYGSTANNTLGLAHRDLRVQQLEQEKLESVDAWNSQLEKASARVKELEQENNGLKVYVNRQGEYIEMLNNHMYMEYSEEFQFTDLSPKQSLAQHDKEVAVKAIKDLNKYVVGNFPNGFLHSTAEYIKQLQEQE